ncbi:MAG: autotransporter outer membrane beta-barrel domain-containing protein [Bdellovibrionales bacterium]|nr:autotransporter outer membrane beta-barrel domain-containing protein [Bdellovibrionales bacterium]
MRLFLAKTIVILCTFVNYAFAQQNLVSGETLYHSPEDELITIQKISVLPMLDNVGGIYSRPLEKHLIEIIEKDHHWDYSEINLVGPLISPEELEADPQKVSQLSTGTQSDGLIAARLIKGPSGISIKLNLFSTKDFKLIAFAEAKNLTRFEVQELKANIKDLFSQVVKKIPYDGIILSRQGQRVTINLGKNDGIEEGRVLSVVQIVKLNRHPKFNFLINAEKEVLGKVKLIKVDETLAFGKVILEKEKGVIQKGSKIAGIDFIKYNVTETLNDNTSTQDKLLNRPDGLVTFGKGATAWLPKRPPTFGMVYAGLGNSLYSYTVQQTQGHTADSFFNPFINIGGELWLSPTWTIHAAIRQGIISIENPVSGSTPDDLSASMSTYEFMIGYKFRLAPTVWGPQVELLGGMSNYDLKVDDTSPRSLTSTKYSGLRLGLRGSFPLDKKQDWSLGADLSFIFNPSIDEAPAASGTSPDSSINEFGIFVFRKIDLNIRMQAGLDFELFKTNFSSGSTTTSSSQKYTSLNFGLAYMF